MIILSMPALNAIQKLPSMILSEEKTLIITKPNFALKGKHNNVDCFKCHKDSKNPETVFTDRLGLLKMIV